MPVAYHDLPWFHFTFLILAVKTTQIIIPQILRQALCSCPGSRNQNRPVSVPFQSFEILCQHLKAAVIRVDAFCLNSKPLSHKKRLAFHFQRAHPDHAEPVQKFYDFIGRKKLRGFFHLPGSCHFFCTIFSRLFYFVFCQTSFFQKPGRFIQEHQRVLRIKVIDKRNFSVTSQSVIRRVNNDLLQIFYRSLAVHIKSTDRIHFIFPEFNTDRQFLGKRVNINDSTTNSKLSRSIHLGFPVITKFYDLLLEGFKFHCFTI